MGLVGNACLLQRYLYLLNFMFEPSISKLRLTPRLAQGIFLYAILNRHYDAVKENSFIMEGSIDLLAAS